MDKTILENFAKNSRSKLRSDVETQMNLLGITADGIADSINTSENIETYEIGLSTHNIYDTEIKQRKNLVDAINSKIKTGNTYEEAYNSIIEEVAYTWFNRIIAIRYMEINNYLPTKTRVLSSEDKTKKEPDLVTEALELEELNLTQEDKKHVFKLKEENKQDELFKFLFIHQCNQLNQILPELFEKTEDYTELLLDISYTDTESVILKLVEEIPEEYFEDQVEIIGWLYQYYNTELKDHIYENKRKEKFTKENIPAVTQLFTPDWIVKYLVENSLGKLWLEGHPTDYLQKNWDYYLEYVDQEQAVEEQLKEIKKESTKIKPEEIKIIDPSMGSGHILVYVIEVLMQIYENEGYTQKEAIESILENNIYGLDIDKRAYQLAYFAVMMKARSYNRRILTKDIKLNLYSIEESNEISKEILNQLNLSTQTKKDLEYLIDIFVDAKEYGSILNIKEEIDFDRLSKELEEIKNNKTNLTNISYKKEIRLLNNLINQSKLLTQKYDIVITNPPYMGQNRMSSNLKEFLNENYPNSKADLFSVFIEKGNSMIKNNGFNAMVTMETWMFIKSFKKFREELFKNVTITGLLHMGMQVMIGFGTSATIFRRFSNLKFNNQYINVNLDDLNQKTRRPYEFPTNNKKNNIICLKDLESIPGIPVAYWASKNHIKNFDNRKIEDIAQLPKGIATGDNNKYLRKFWEVNYNKLFSKWIPCAKGGEFRKYYGNNEYVIDWSKSTKKFYKENKRSRIRSESIHFKKGITYSVITSRSNFRYLSKEHLFSNSGNSIIDIDDNIYLYLLSFLNSQLVRDYLKILNPTITITINDLKRIPFILNKEHKTHIEELTRENLDISREDWDSYETSLDFKRHPLIKEDNTSIEEAFKKWNDLTLNNFNTTKNNELEINSLFDEIYGVTSTELTDSDISLNLADREGDIKSFISYAVGCMFGRYSLNEDGIVYAGGEFDLNNYNKFVPDDDNIIPVLDTDYFDDDIVNRFCDFVGVCFGKENLEKNLKYIADSLNNKGSTSREVIRNYFLKDFYKDHVKMYQKCPIYWYFTSGNKDGFNCLIYMHRYNPDTLSRIRTDYLHKTQRAINDRINTEDNIISNSSSTKEVQKAKKEKNKLEKQLDETRVYDDVLGYMAAKKIGIDLDDGVKVNYAKFQKVEISNENQKVKKVDLLKKI